jgi:hypothetical protein
MSTFAKLVMHFAILAAPSAAIASLSVDPGYTGMWYDPARNGEGLVVEVIDPQRAVVFWFTYDESGGQRWLHGLGRIEVGATGTTIDLPELITTHGGRFDDAFDPQAVVREVVGSAELRFTDCDNGTWHYQAFGQQQAIDVVRLSQTMGATCGSPHGRPGDEIAAHAGQSGSWYQPSRNGEGFQLQWSDKGEALLTWYAYSNDGSPLWLIGVGQIAGGDIEFPVLYIASGARFGQAFDPDYVQLESWGRLRLTLGCDSGVAEFSSHLHGFGSGTREVVRLTHAVPFDCPWIRPRLTDLYSITFTKLRSDGPVGTPERGVEARTLVDDGAVFGTALTSDGSGGRLLRWTPDPGEWELLSDVRVATDFPPFARARDRVVVNNIALAGEEARTVFEWTEAEGLQPLQGMHLYRSGATAASRTNEVLAGRGLLAPGSSTIAPWTWTELGGQASLPWLSQPPSPVIFGIADDARVAIGAAVRSVGGLSVAAAVRWVDGEREFLYDEAGLELGFANTCSADCRTVFGTPSVLLPLDHPRRNHAWYRLRDGRVGYLNDPGSIVTRYEPAAVSADGTLLGGRFSEAGSSRAFLWTQGTGIVDVEALLSEIGSPIDWQGGSAIGSITADGRAILVVGREPPPGSTSATRNASGILTLVPRPRLGE